jgi:hypothetical protein
MAKKLILGIHGIGNKPPKEQLRQWWIKSVNDGLSGIDSSGMDYDLEIIYWADFFYGTPLDPSVEDRKDPLYVKRPYAPPVYIARKWEAHELRKRILDHIEQGLDRIFYDETQFFDYNSIADRILSRLSRDMNNYYHEKCIKSGFRDLSASEAVRAHAAACLREYEGRDIMLIGHSMGAVVAYDTLTLAAPDLKIDTLVTMGAPLGLPLIVNKICAERRLDFEKKRKCPGVENVSSAWYNLSDLYDRVAVKYSLRDVFGANALGVAPEDIVVKNTYEYKGRKNRHKSYGYLRTLEMAEIIRMFILS